LAGGRGAALTFEPKRHEPIPFFGDVGQCPNPMFVLPKAAAGGGAPDWGTHG